jgi:hypothetical protein
MIRHECYRGNPVAFFTAQPEIFIWLIGGRKRGIEEEY